MIIEDYCSYEVSKLLKEYGFAAKCHSYYTRTGMIFNHWNCHYFAEDKHDEVDFETQTLRPTHQMAMKWLREVHHIIFVFKPSYFSGDECTYWTYERWCGDNFDGEVLSFKTYEEAVDAALKYSLENLVQYD